MDTCYAEVLRIVEKLEALGCTRADAIALLCDELDEQTPEPGGPIVDWLRSRMDEPIW